MKLDVEGEYVANIVDRERNIPRLLPSRSLLKLYFLSPNSRYYISAALLMIGVGGLIILLGATTRQHYPSDIPMLMVVGLLALVPLLLPLLNAQRIQHAIRHGITAMGKVGNVESARDTPYSTPEGMRNGSIRVEVSYTVDGQSRRSRLFLDRPWVGQVKAGTSLRLLIDPSRASKPYVVGIANEPKLGFPHQSGHEEESVPQYGGRLNDA